MLEWVDQHNPFATDNVELFSLSTGITSSSSDGVNCDKAEEVGLHMQAHLNGVNFGSAVLKKKHHPGRRINH